MKTENTLRTAKNSLLGFFTALGAGFLVACGSSGSPSPATSTPQEFPAYLVDTAVEGVEYSGPEGDGLTGKGGVFLANEGEFVFSIGGTTLGSVQMSSNQENNEVTPADFIGVNEAQVITIARILQALDADVSDLGLRNGISISQAARDDQEGVSALKVLAGNTDDERENVAVGGVNTYTLPSADNARDHLVATRKCLFSGGYVGDFEGTLSDDTATSGQSYYAVEPFVNRARMFATAGDGGFRLFETSTVGVIGSTITLLSPGNELSFITPRLVAGVWQYTDDDGNVTSSGTENLTLAAGTGNPGATRRVVGFETTNMVTVAGMYVLDYFEGATVFRGRHYEVDVTSGSVSVSSMPLSLTIVNSASWPVSADGASNGMTTVTLTLSGMRGEEAASITLGIVRAESLEDANENYGSFEGVGNELSGTWCDIGGAVGSTVAPTPSPRTPPAPSASFTENGTVIEVTWSAVPSATSYNLYRSTVSGGPYGDPIEDDISALRYEDTGRSAGTEYFYRLEACNSGGCSGLSPAGSSAVVTPPVATSLGECTVGLELTFEQSCSWEGYTFTVESDGNAVLFDGGVFDRRFDQDSANFSLTDVRRIFGATRTGNDDGTIRFDMWRINQVDLR